MRQFNKLFIYLFLILGATETLGLTEIYYVHNDHLGTPQVVTDENQNVVWQGEYGPFGELLSESGTLDQPIRFPGQIADAETGYYYNYFRDYDPTLGRYIQSDPIGLGDGPNTYTYVKNNPVMYTDPTGEFAVQAFGFAFGAGLEYFTNPCASLSDILLAGAMGALGGGLGSGLQKMRNIRQAYHTGLNAGKGKGLSPKQAYDLRRDLGRDLKDATPFKGSVYKRNQAKYGDELGPPFDPVKHADVNKTLSDTSPVANALLKLPPKGMGVGGAAAGGYGGSHMGDRCGCQ